MPLLKRIVDDESRGTFLAVAGSNADGLHRHGRAEADQSGGWIWGRRLESQGARVLAKVAERWYESR